MKKAFTLIELLVVIAIIALLMSVIVPSLKLAKQKAASIVCMVNTKNLSLAWFSYKEDNNSELMSSCMEGITVNNRTIPGWIGAPRDQAGIILSAYSGTVTDEDEFRGIELGAIYPYVNTYDVFNCPADKVKAANTDTLDPEKFVTYCVPDCFAGVHGHPSGGGYASKDNRVYKYSNVKMPSNVYNFVESAETRNYIALGHFVFGGRDLDTKITGSQPEVWWGPMAINHGDSSTMGFADGHAERRKWQHPYTKERLDRVLITGSYQLDLASGQNSSNNEDIAYMAQGWGYGRAR